MKRCPTCQKEFPDSLRFCQTDGTPLVEAVETPVPEDPFKTMVAPPIKTPTNVQDDPMKTMVVSSDTKDEEILQIPEVFDPMKTMVVSDDAKKSIPPSKPFSEPVVSAPEPPKFNEPNLSPPNFGDLSGTSTDAPKFEQPKPIEPPKPDSPFSTPFSEPPKIDPPKSSPFSEPPKIGTPVSPFSEPPKFDSPVSSSFNEPPKFDPKPENSPFNQPSNSPVSSPFTDPPPFKEPAFNNPPPIDNSPFNQPQTPFGQQENEQFNQPKVEQNDWNQPAAPVANWQDQGVDMNNQYAQPPAGGAGQNNTLAIVSLVLGILSFVCLGLLGSIPAIITGYMQKSKIKTNPMEFGGGVMATIGMVLGALNIVLTVVVLIIYVILIVANSR